ncbi:hypothetical protein ACFV9D_18245 [Streptomyces sp. NPDC059875]|uniref:hypothetical protein n=1 Tax=unclassified Streptomyces TaxID=2593676 RepID=UPI00364D90B5
MPRTEPAVPAGGVVPGASGPGTSLAACPDPARAEVHGGTGREPRPQSAVPRGPRPDRAGVAPATPVLAVGRGIAGPCGRPTSALWRVVVPVLLVLAAVFGACAGVGGPGGSEARPAASGAADPGGETHESGETEAAAPAARSRSHGRAARRGAGRRRGPEPSDGAAGAPAPAKALPHDARQCVVMRC